MNEWRTYTSDLSKFLRNWVNPEAEFGGRHTSDQYDQLVHRWAEDVIRVRSPAQYCQVLAAL